MITQTHGHVSREHLSTPEKALQCFDVSSLVHQELHSTAIVASLLAPPKLSISDTSSSDHLFPVQLMQGVHADLQSKHGQRQLSPSCAADAKQARACEGKWIDISRAQQQ